ncbi:MAG: hypothetical protein LBN39_13135, partial [Planctomycetaceae bacterium]|nr:hypothetical protein [Planctomycetaceae bacterium]
WFIGTDPVTGAIKDPKVGIALTHSLFNITNTLLYLPFIRIAAEFLERLIPNNEEENEKQRVTSLSVQRLEPYSMSIERSRIEVIRMGNTCLQLADRVQNIIGGECSNQNEIEEAFLQEELLDYLQDEVIEYTAGLLSGNISHDIGETAQQQLRMADELESISDYLIAILKSDITMHKDGLVFPDEQKAALKELHDGVRVYIADVIKFYTERRTAFAELMTEVHTHGRTLTQRAKDLRAGFIKELTNSETKYDPRVVIALNTQINAYRRVREHAQNVAEAVAGAK